jgi:hypothetical protein
MHQLRRRKGKTKFTAMMGQTAERPTPQGRYRAPCVGEFGLLTTSDRSPVYHR